MKATQKKSNRKWLAGLAGLLALLVLVATNETRVASAHTELLSSDPAPGAVLVRAPEKIQLSFTRDLNISLSRVTVWDDNHNDLSQTPAQPIDGDNKRLEVKLKPYSGRYNIIWVAVSAGDGHVDRGAYAFFAGNAAPNINPAELAQSSKLVQEINQAEASGQHEHNVVGADGSQIHLISSNPPANSVFNRAPASLRLDFDRPLDLQTSQIAVWDQQQQVLLQNGNTQINPDDPTTLTIGLKNVPGLYIVMFAATALEGGAVTHGTFIFQVDPAAPNAYSGTPAPSSNLDVTTLLSQEQARSGAKLGPLELVNWFLMWVSYSALLLLAGGVFFRRLVWEKVVKQLPGKLDAGLAEGIGIIAKTARRRWLRTTQICLLVMLACLPLRVGCEALTVADGDWLAAFGNIQVIGGILFGSSLGWSLVAQAIILLAGLGLTAWKAGRKHLILLGVLGLGLVVCYSVTGHAAGSLVSVLAAGGHLLAGIIWLGSMLYLGLVLLPALSVRRNPAGRALLLASLDRFAPLALISVGILIVSGVMQAGLRLSSPDNLLNTAYGFTLLVKHALVMVMLALSAYHVLLLRPGLKRALQLAAPVGWLYRRLDFVLRLEAGWGVAVLVCAAGLATFPAPL